MSRYAFASGGRAEGVRGATATRAVLLSLVVAACSATPAVPSPAGGTAIPTSGGSPSVSASAAGTAASPTPPSTDPAGVPIGSLSPEPTDEPDRTDEPEPTPEPTPVPDDDGVPDDMEQQVGDGNGDGIDDAEQGNVASLVIDEEGQYVTLAVAAPLSLAEVRTADAPTGPAGVSFPLGAVAAVIDDLEPGSLVDLRVHLGASLTPGGYWKRAADGSWADLSWDGTTGARFLGSDVVRLTLRDGGRGDADGQADGRVVDPGAVAETGNQPPEPALAFGRTIADPWLIDYRMEGTRDPDGRIRSLSLEFGDGDGWGRVFEPTDTSFELVTHQYAANGTYPVTFTVVDDAGLAAIAEHLVLVPPEFRPICSPDRGTTGTTPFKFPFTVRTSWDGDELPGFEGFGPSFDLPNHLFAGIEVDWGDGSPNLTSSFFEPDYVHTYVNQGRYTVTARIGIRHPKTRQVAIEASCSVEVVATGRGELVGTLTAERTHAVTIDTDPEWIEREEMTANVNVVMVRDPDDPERFIDAGTNVAIDRTTTGHRVYGNCTDRWTTETVGSIPLIEAELGDRGGSIQAFLADVDGKRMIYLGLTLQYVSEMKERTGCGFGPTSAPVVETWSCGGDPFTIPGVVAIGPGPGVPVDFTCTRGPGPVLGNDTMTFKVTGTLTLDPIARS